MIVEFCSQKSITNVYFELTWECTGLINFKPPYVKSMYCNVLGKLSKRIHMFISINKTIVGNKVDSMYMLCKSVKLPETIFNEDFGFYANKDNMAKVF